MDTSRPNTQHDRDIGLQLGWSYDFLKFIPSYPRRDDSDFSNKIAIKFSEELAVKGLFTHQAFARFFLSKKTPYQELFLFHNMGSGKTLSSIVVAESYRTVYSSPPLVLVRGDSAMNNFKKQIKKFIGEKDREYDIRTFISFSRRLMYLTDNEILSEYNKRVIIVDEVQNTRSSEEVHGFVYEQIKRLIHMLHDRVILLLTGTPMIDKKQEVCGVMNLILKTPLTKFDLSDKSSFFKKTRGYISFVETNAIEGMPEVIEEGEVVHPLNIKVVVSNMKGIQSAAYMNSCQDEGAVYRHLIYSSLFVLPNGEYGENAYLLVNSPETAPHFSELIRREVAKNYQNYSCKMYTVMKLIQSSPGPVFIFCEEVRGSGLIMIAALLEALGYSPYRGENISLLHVRKRYTVYVGDKSLCPNADDRLVGFCSDKNIKGEYIKILLGSKISGEGINLKNVRQVHIITPHWNSFSTKQAIARAIRLDSHLSLKKEERIVNVYKHVAICTAKDGHGISELHKRSIDLYKYFISQDKENEILVIKEWMKENSVDRYVYSTDAQPLGASLTLQNNDDSQGLEPFLFEEKQNTMEYFLRRKEDRRLIDFANNTMILGPKSNKLFSHMTDYDLVQWCIQTNITKKAFILEESILCLEATQSHQLIRLFHRSIAKTNCPSKPWIHILLCRKPNEASSYSVSSSSLKSNGRLRVLDCSTTLKGREGVARWVFYDQDDEWIMDVFRKEQEKVIRGLSQEGMYMIVSNGDNSIRLVARPSKEKEDFRKVNRGKRIESFSSKELYEMIRFFTYNPNALTGALVPQTLTGAGCKEQTEQMMKKKEMKNILIRFFVSSGRYIIL